MDNFFLFSRRIRQNAGRVQKLSELIPSRISLVLQNYGYATEYSIVSNIFHNFQFSRISFLHLETFEVFVFNNITTVDGCFCVDYEKRYLSATIVAGSPTD